MLKKGDLVIVKNSGYSYTTFDEFYRRNKDDDTNEYDYDKMPAPDSIGTVVGKSEQHDNSQVVLINVKDKCYIISSKGLDSLNLKLEANKIRIEKKYILETTIGDLDITDLIKDLSI